MFFALIPEKFCNSFVETAYITVEFKLHKHSRAPLLSAWYKAKQNSTL